MGKGREIEDRQADMNEANALEPIFEHTALMRSAMTQGGLGGAVPVRGGVTPGSKKSLLSHTWLLPVSPLPVSTGEEGKSLIGTSLP
jgi:hypothetical protein